MRRTPTLLLALALMIGCGPTEPTTGPLTTRDVLTYAQLVEAPAAVRAAFIREFGGDRTRITRVETIETDDATRYRIEYDREGETRAAVYDAAGERAE